ncbi:MAG: tyrosine-type recombinase/integrase [Tyzzerella sp.]|nr:tyrosine-type recombinase/integrase [Tyzzerella sp.]
MNPEIIYNFEKFLKNKGYAPQTIHTYTKALEQAPDSWNVTDPQLLYEHINHTLTDNNQTFSPSTRHNIGPASSLLFQMQTGEVFRNYDRNQKYKTTRNKELLEEFFKYSTEFKHITSMSATAECHHISVFLDSLDSIPDDWSMLTAEDIKQYVCTVFQNIKASSIGRYITSLRNFFRFLEYKGYVINRSVLELPLTSADWQKSNVPIILTSDEEKRLRFHYKNDEEMGIRNNIIIRLMLDLGLRCSEIPNIMLRDIKWTNALIQIHDTKNNHVRQLPLSAELGKLLEEYILRYRPSVPSEKHLLLRKYVNRYTCMSRENVRYVIRNAFEKEHITGYWKGTHALRRTAASKIFNNGTGLKLTADILGHESLDSTKAYIKVDFEHLKAVAAPWPGGDCDGK